MSKVSDKHSVSVARSDTNRLSQPKLGGVVRTRLHQESARTKFWRTQGPLGKRNGTTGVALRKQKAQE